MYDPSDPIFMSAFYKFDADFHESTKATKLDLSNIYESKPLYFHEYYPGIYQY